MFDKREKYLRHTENAREDTGFFAVVDAAIVPMFPVYLEGYGVENTCLFDGEAFENHSTEAPYLVRVEPHSQMTEFLLSDVADLGACIFVQSQKPIRRLKTHLKKFTKIIGPEGDEWFFKFYLADVFPPQCKMFKPEQRQSFFREIDTVLSFIPDEPLVIRQTVGIDKLERLEVGDA